MSASGSSGRLTIQDIARMHADGQRIPMLTAYDYPTARILDEAGIPMLLVGDSLGEVVLGYESTVRVSMDEMLHHARAVVRGAERALVVVDMPFLTYERADQAVDNAGRFLRDAGVQAVKVEGGVRTGRAIEAIVRAGIPVMGHIGWTPQARLGMGRARVQGRTREAAQRLLTDALAVQEAGAFAMVLELVPEQLAAAITSRLRFRPSGSGPAPVQWAGPGDHRPAGPGRLRATTRQAVRAHSRHDPGSGAGVRRRRGRQGLPGGRGVQPDGRGGPEEALGHGELDRAAAAPFPIPLDRDL